MCNNSCWGTDSWWIIILFAIVLIWICCGSTGQDNSSNCCTPMPLDCGCGGCCR